MSANAVDPFERIRALQGVLAIRAVEGERWRRVAGWLGAALTLTLTAVVVIGLYVLRPPSLIEPVDLLAEPLGGTTLCDKYWQATGQPCAGGCWYEKDCYICDQNGCTYSHTVRACFPSGGAACPLGNEIPDYLFVDENGLPIEPSGEYVKSPAPQGPF